MLVDFPGIENLESLFLLRFYIVGAVFEQQIIQRFTQQNSFAHTFLFGKIGETFQLRQGKVGCFWGHLLFVGQSDRIPSGF